MHVPEIIYLANKSENGFEGDLLADFYRMFPQAAQEVDRDGNPLEPIFVSAEHGDGLTDLFQALRKRIPEAKFSQYGDRKQKRVERFYQYKQMLLDEYVESAAKEKQEEDDSGDEMGKRDLDTFIA